MAKLYGEIGASALMTFDKSFARSNGQPLDSTEVFYSKSAAETYAAGEVAYVGQKIVVVETVKKNVDGVETDVTVVTHYGIEPDNSLKELGSAPIGDGKSIVVADDGTISVVGFADADEGAQPRKKADGTIEWVVPSTDTVDGLQKTVAGLQSDVDNLEKYVGTFDSETATTVVEYVDEAVANIDERVTIIEDDYLKAADKTEVLKAVEDLSKYVGTIPNDVEASTVVGYIDAKIGDIPEQTDYSITVEESSPEGYAKAYTFKQLGSTVATVNIPKDMVVESGSVVTDPDAEHIGTYIKLVLANANEDELLIDVGTLIEYVTGGTAADGMITVAVDPTTHVATATINDGTVTLAKLETSIRTAIGKAHAHENADVLAGITSEKVAAWDAAQVNVIDSVDTAQFALDENKKLTLLDVAMDKVTGLDDALDGKVDKVEGSRLITSDEATKLEKLVLGENGSVQVSGTIAAGNVDGLADWITNRAGSLEGLSENNFDDTLLEKLNGIAEGAQVNVIDGVSDEFAISADGKVLSVKAVEMDKVTGLPEALAGKVDVVEGKGLSTNDFTDTLLEKLNGIAEGAEVNYVKSVTNEFTVSAEGELAVASVNVNKLVQTEGEVLILNGGSSV